MSQNIVVTAQLPHSCPPLFGTQTAANGLKLGISAAVQRRAEGVWRSDGRGTV